MTALYERLSRDDDLTANPIPSKTRIHFRRIRAEKRLLWPSHFGTTAFRHDLERLLEIAGRGG
jgi:hypothetical protein